jgi:cytochrome b pre-mRNA-processing protein 3
MYSAAVQAARDTWFYQAPPDGLGVADTLDGRFDLISLHAFLVIRQLRRQPEPGAAIAQAVFDAMFSDMDRNLREMGVGDLGVSKRVRSMWEAFHGRASAYEVGLDAAERDGNESELAEALARNIWRGGAVPAGSAAALARLCRRQAAALAARDLIGGEAAFAPARDAAAA